METKIRLAWDVDRASAELASVLAGCTEAEACVRCGHDSRTVAAIANHVAEWLHLVAEAIPDLTQGRGDRLHDEVVDEIDAAIAKATANRSLSETRTRLVDGAGRLRDACGGLEQRELDVVVQSATPQVTVASVLRRWGYSHVIEHTSVIRTGLLAARNSKASDVH